MLYHDRSIRRSAFACARVDRGLALQGTVAGVLEAFFPRRGLVGAAVGVLARGRPLLVAECFLPGFWTLPAHER